MTRRMKTHIKLGICSVSPSHQSPNCLHEETLVSPRILTQFLREMSRSFTAKSRGVSPRNVAEKILGEIRDESYITSWGGGEGGGYIQGGTKMFLVTYWGGLKVKWPMGRGVVMYFVRYWGGQMCSTGLFFSLKVVASRGHSPPDPPISQLYNVRLSKQLGDIGNKICPILVKQ